MSSSSQRIAGFIHGAAYNHVDHLTPLCVLLGIPLIVTEEEIAACCRKYYPGIEVIVLDHQSLAFSVVQAFDTIVTTLPHDLFHEIFFFAEKLLGKTLKTIWCPHGNSDKGHRSYFMEALSKETHAFVYGQKMIDFLVEKGVFVQLQNVMRTGNFRRKFAELHRDFYQKVVEKGVFSCLPNTNRTILYAPTWEDAEDSSSFFSIAPALIEQLPEHFNLIVKPHPNLRWQREGEALEILARYAKPNLTVLWDFPPVYPLLERVDIYIGDLSSIGYDFLAFNRPMFFLRNQNVYRNNLKDREFDKEVPQNFDSERATIAKRQGASENQNSEAEPMQPKPDSSGYSGINPTLFLFRCGFEIPESAYHQIYPFIEKKLCFDGKFSFIRKETYAYTFDPETSVKQVYNATRSSH